MKRIKIKLSLANKMILYFILIALGLLGITMVYVLSEKRDKLVENTKKRAYLHLNKQASDIEHIVNKNFDVGKGILYSLSDYDYLDYKLRKNYIKQIVTEVIDDNPDYISFWIQFELAHIDTNYTGKLLRQRFTGFKKSLIEGVDFEIDTLTSNVNKLSVNDGYTQIKYLQEATLTEPYWDSYTNQENDKIFMSSICLPIIENNKSIGVLGIDITLDYFKEKFDELNKRKGEYIFLASNNGTLISYPNHEDVGKNIKEVFSPEFEVKHRLSTFIQSGKPTEIYEIDPLTKEQGYFFIIPIQLGEANNPWSIGLFVSGDKINKKISTTFMSTTLLIIIGLLIILIGIGFIIQTQVSKPLTKAVQNLHCISKGNVNITPLKDNKSKEIHDVVTKINNLSERLRQTITFTQAIIKGDFTLQYKKQSDGDVLGESLLNMRTNLSDAQEKLDVRKKEDEIRNWEMKGSTEFGHLLRRKNDNVDDLTHSILKYLTEYLNCIQGSLIVRNVKDLEIVFELVGSLAYGRYKNSKQEFLLQEGLVGRCAYEKITLYMEDVPDEFVNVTSGLGKENPKNVLLVPAILDYEVYAVLELISYNKLKDYEIKFVESVSEGIASTIANVKANEQTKRLIENSKKQNSELATQEEEIRQNLEELQATQEEAKRLQKEEDAKIKKLEQRKKTLSNVLDNIPFRIFVKDEKGTIILANQKLATDLGLDKKSIIDKPEHEILEDKEAAHFIWEDDRKVIEGNDIVTNNIQDYFTKHTKLIKTTKVPIFINYLQQKGILYVQMDIDEIVDMDNEIKKLQKILLSL